MKKLTLLLFAFTLLFASNAFAGGPGSGRHKGYSSTTTTTKRSYHKKKSKSVLETLSDDKPVKKTYQKKGYYESSTIKHDTVYKSKSSKSKLNSSKNLTTAAAPKMKFGTPTLKDTIYKGSNGKYYFYKKNAQYYVKGNKVKKNSIVIKEK